MHYVYILRSLSTPNETYVGHTDDLKQRLKDHNAGRSPHTSKFTPWVIAFYCAFDNAQLALDFEAYLKSHSGRAFARKRLLAAA
jgi:predicted GIY-YIG superfamily endonuclease